MKISVIVTTYNRPDALKRVLDGLLHQTRLPDEIIIADDGSDDSTKAMLHSYFDHPQIRIKHVWQEDHGFRPARIRNKAILKSIEDYLIIMDGDCIPTKHFVEDHHNLAAKGYFFQGKRVLVNKKIADQFNLRDINAFFRLLFHAMVFNLSNSHHICRIPFFPSYSTLKLSGIRGCNMGFFKKDLVAVNGYNQAFKGWGREDSELVVRLYKYGLKRKENPFKAVCYHLWHHKNKRNYLAQNDEILKKTIQSDAYICKSGLVNRRNY